MTGFFKKAALGGALAATALTAAAPAEAQRYRDYRHHRGGGDAAAGALVGGIIGLGLGAAIASSNNNRYYDRGYYDNGPRGYYDSYPRSYYNSYQYDYRPACFNERRFDYYGRPYRVRICR